MEKTISKKIRELSSCLKNGKIYDTDYLINCGILDLFWFSNNIIELLRIKEGDTTFSSEEFHSALIRAINLSEPKLEFKENEEDELLEIFKGYSLWWNLKNQEYKTVLKEIKPIIKKEGLPKPENMDDCYHYWYIKKEKKHAHETFAPSKGLVIEYLRYEKSKYDSLSEEISPALLEVDTHRVALLYELGVISLIEERLHEAGKYSANKCAQVVVEMLGIKDPKRLKTIAGYIRGIKNPNDLRNYPLGATSKTKVITVLSKVNLEIKNL